MTDALAAKNHETNVLLTQIVKSWVIHICNAQRFHRRRVLAELHKKEKHASYFEYRLVNSDVSCVDRSEAGS